MPDAFKTNIFKVSAGTKFSCAINLNQDLNCWPTYSQIFIPPQFQSSILDVSSKADHGCIINSSNHLACFGFDMHGETEIPSHIKHVK